LIIGAWEGDVKSFSANMLNAVAKMVSAYGKELDDDLFKEKVGAASLKQLTRTAKERRPGCMGLAEAMVLEYNGKKKNNAYKLSINKLYAKESAIIKKVDGIQDDMLRDEASAFFGEESFYPVEEPCPV